MKLLTPDTSAEDVYEFFKWNNRLSDYTNEIKIEPTKNFDHRNASKFNWKVFFFEQQFNDFLPDKQLELLYKTLSDEKRTVETILETVKGQDPNRYPYSEYFLAKKVHIDYVSGNNKQLISYQHEIKLITEGTLKDVIISEVEGEQWEFAKKLKSMFDPATEWVPQFSYNQTPIKEVAEYFFERKIESVIDETIGRIQFINYLQKKVDTLGPVPQSFGDIPQKLTWLGTPAQFAYIMDLLIDKGYIQKPTPKGEKSASVLLNLFEFKNHQPSKESLGKYLHKDLFAIKNPEHQKLFNKIPHRNELDR